MKVKVNAFSDMICPPNVRIFGCSATSTSGWLDDENLDEDGNETIIWNVKHPFSKNHYKQLDDVNLSFRIVVLWLHRSEGT